MGPGGRQRARVGTAGERLQLAAAALAYVLLTVPIGALCVALLAVAGLVGVALSPLGVGSPVLSWPGGPAGRYAQLERALATRLLGARIPPLPRRSRVDAS